MFKEYLLQFLFFFQNKNHSLKKRGYRSYLSAKKICRNSKTQIFATEIKTKKKQDKNKAQNTTRNERI